MKKQCFGHNETLFWRLERENFSSDIKARCSLFPWDLHFSSFLSFMCIFSSKNGYYSLVCE